MAILHMLLFTWIHANGQCVSQAVASFVAEFKANMSRALGIPNNQVGEVQHIKSTASARLAQVHRLSPEQHTHFSCRW